MRRYSIPRNIWRAIYPFLIFFGLTFFVVFAASVGYGGYMGARAVLDGAEILDTEEMSERTEAFIEENFIPMQLVASAIGILVFGLMWQEIRKKLPQYDGTRLRALAAVLSVVIFAGLNYVMVSVFGLVDIDRFFPTYEEHALSYLGGSFIVRLLLIGIVGPIAEELLCRGVVFNRLEAWMPTWAAVLASSTLFGVMHINLFQILYTFVVGLALCILYVRFRNLWIPIIGHVAFNSANILFLELIDGTAAEEIGLALMLVLSPFLVAAGIVLMKKRTEAAVPAGGMPVAGPYLPALINGGRSGMIRGRNERKWGMVLKNEDKGVLLKMYRSMLTIRTFEEKARSLTLEGKLYGALHLYSGEEAVASGVCSCLRETDCVTSTHRGHGHCIAKGADTKRMMAELFGKVTGYSKGKGGSMHIADMAKGVIGANGIVGAGMPIATGVAFAQKYNGEDNVTVAFFGDGATNRGTFHESLNMAASQNLPLIFACENNNYGMSTPFSYHSRNKTIAQRAKAYDIPGAEADGNDILAVREATMEAVERARAGGGPTLLEFRTWRQHGHFLNDQQKYKDPKEQEAWLAQDPIPRFEKRLIEDGIADQALLDSIRADVVREIEEAVQFGMDSPEPAYEVLFEDLYV